MTERKQTLRFFNDNRNKHKNNKVIISDNKAIAFTTFSSQWQKHKPNEKTNSFLMGIRWTLPCATDIFSEQKKKVIY